MLIVERSKSPILRFPCKDAHAVMEYGLRKVARRRRHIYGTFESLPHKLGHPTDMVQVRVRDDERVERRDVVRKRRTGLRFVIVPPLLNTAVNQELALLAFHEEVRTGYRFRSAVGSYFERHRVMRATKYTVTAPSVSITRSVAVSSG